MLEKVTQTHEHGTRLARRGMFVSTRDHRRVGYRIPKEWQTVTETMQKTATLGAFKRQSKGEFVEGYGQFRCTVRGCYVCGKVRGEGGHGEA